MPQFYGYGDQWLTEEQFRSSSDADLRGIARRRMQLGRGAPFSEMLRPASALESTLTAAPIGIGKPLSVEIAFAYTGALSKKGWHRPDLLIASSVKRLPIYDAAPRAMQAVLEAVPEHHGFSSLPANVPGTPLVYHTSALTDRGVTVTLEMVFDRFPAEAFDQVGNMLSTAAGIPVFAPASAFLLAGSMIVKLFAKAAETMIDGTPAFSESLNVNVERPLYEDTSPGFLLLTPSNALAAGLGNGTYTIEASRGVLDSGSREYDGPDPYVIVSLDGSNRPDYANFTPTMATASILNRFLHISEGQPTTTGLILDAMRAYNDIYYRSMADSLKKRLDSMDPASDETKKMKQLLAAYIGNINNDDLKPKS